MRVFNVLIALTASLAAISGASPVDVQVSHVQAVNDHFALSSNTTLVHLDRRNPIGAVVARIAGVVIDQFLSEGASAVFDWLGIFKSAGTDPVTLSRESLQEIKKVVKEALEQQQVDLLMAEFDAKLTIWRKYTRSTGDLNSAADTVDSQLLNPFIELLSHFERVGDKYIASINGPWQIIVGMYLLAFNEYWAISELAPVPTQTLRDRFQNHVEVFVKPRMQAFLRMVNTFLPTDTQYPVNFWITKSDETCCTESDCIPMRKRSDSIVPDRKCPPPVCRKCPIYNAQATIRMFTGPNDYMDFPGPVVSCEQTCSGQNARDWAADRAKKVSDNFLPQYREAKKDIVFSAEHRALYSTLDNLAKATFTVPWRCIRFDDNSTSIVIPARAAPPNFATTDPFIPVQIECMSNDGANCISTPTKDTCKTEVTNNKLREASLKPIRCSSYTPGTWCGTARAALTPSQYKNRAANP
ncbi:hypothetical protein HDU97_003135 [Phlyctochytrium planicorne]|nr:hypothetical protein HDU97_003086 [Phlyctochytrium planicorne]KAJ3109705.1 hypothetical protein HDU97_003135 [Phlyctochytrium planicorne]